MKLTRWISAVVVTVTLAACETSALAPRTNLASTPSASPRSGRGTVTGTFMREGGAITPDGTQPPAVPLTGTVTFAAGHRRTVAVQVGESGRFSVTLRAGDYVVVGRSPSILEVRPSGRSVEDQCSQPAAITVVTGRTVRLSVICVVP